MKSPEFSRNRDAAFTIIGAPGIDITFCTTRIARIRLGVGARDPVWSYLADYPAPTAAVQIEQATASIDTGSLTLRLLAGPPRLAMCDRAGRSRLDITLASAFDEQRKTLRLDLVGEQHFCGLGQGGAFDRLGVTRRLWNGHINHGSGAEIAIPLLLSNAGYGLFFDNTGMARLEAGDSDSHTWLDYSWEQGPLDLYYIAGDTIRDALGAAGDLLGRAPMPPRWSLGYLQSTRHFDSSEELRRLPETFRDKKLPCDAIILLSTYGEADGWNRSVGQLECNPALLPDPGKMFADFHASDFRVVVHEYPVLHRDSPLNEEAGAKAFLLDFAYPSVGRGPRNPAGYMDGQRFIDFSRQEAGAWWWRQHRALIDHGVDGWWLDGGEGPPSETKLHAGPGAALHNRYDLMRYQAFVEGEARDRPDSRPFFLSRSGGPGMQRFGVGCWTGDINNTFTTLEAQIAAGLNVGMSGVPYWGTDIGGYYNAAPSGGELFARWFQFGAFCPIFRAHGREWRERLPWAYGPAIEAICRRYLELRYRLMPYTYTLARQAHRHGLPLMRPLVLNYPDDPNCWAMDSEFLWGDDLLVAPVTRAGASHWPVYLPRGTWRDFWTHDAIEGPCAITVETPLDRLPLFVRAGAIVPMSPVVQHLSGPPTSDLTLLVYPSGTSSFTLYDDDGATKAYQRGRHALTEFQCVAEERRLICRVTTPSGDTGVVPKDRRYTFQIFMPAPPLHVALENGRSLPQGRDAGPASWWHDGENFLFVRLVQALRAVTIAW